jgi:hypothetical protein
MPHFVSEQIASSFGSCAHETGLNGETACFLRMKNWRQKMNKIDLKINRELVKIRL